LHVPEGPSPLRVTPAPRPLEVTSRSPPTGCHPRESGGPSCVPSPGNVAGRAELADVVIPGHRACAVGGEGPMGPRFRGGDIGGVEGVRWHVRRVSLTPPGALRAPPSPSRGGRRRSDVRRSGGEGHGPPLARG